VRLDRRTLDQRARLLRQRVVETRSVLWTRRAA
jgi:hypothetical protein